MKLLFVNNFRKRGGGEEFLRDLLPGLAERGVGVGLVCRPGTPLEDMFRDSSVALHPLPWSVRHAGGTIRRLAGILATVGYDVVNVQRGHDVVEAWAAVRLSRRKPLLAYTSQVPEFVRSRALLRRLDRVITISRYIRDRLADFCPSIAGRITVIHYGIDLARFRPGTTPRGWLRRRFGVGPGDPVIGTVGDLWKNQIEFLDALAEIRSAFPAARYALVADPATADAEVFRQRAAALGLSEAVLWAGRLAKADMPAFYADLDLAVSAYRNEGFGIWVLEALAMGVPVVAFDAGGVRDSLEGCPGGVLVRGGSADMARAVRHLLEDGALRARLALAGPPFVTAKFHRERMIEDYYRFFVEWTGARGRC